MLRNVLANWTEMALTVVSVFVLYPFLVGSMGDDQYGLWLLISSITAYMGLLSLGVPLATVRHVAKYRALRDDGKMNEAVNTSLVLYTGMALAVLVVGSVLAVFLDDLFKVPARYVRPAQLAMLVAVSTTALGFLFEVLEGALSAFERFVPLAAVKSTVVVVRVALTFLLVRADTGLVVIALVLAGTTVAQGAALYLLVRRYEPALRFHPSLATREMMRSVFGYSVYALLLQAATLMSFRSAPMVIGAVLSAGAIVYFSAANSFLLYLTEAVRGIARAIMPRSSHLEAQRDLAGLRETWIDFSRLTYLVILPACVLFVTLGGDFIAIWLGEQYREDAGRVLTILSVSYQFFLVQRGVAYPILMGISRLKWPTVAMLITAVVNIGLSVALAFDLGVEGVAWGTTLPNLANTVFMVIYTARVLGVAVGPYLLRTHLIPSLGIPFLAIPSLAMRRLVPIDGYGTFALAVGVSLAVYAVAAFFLVGARQREGLRRKLLRRPAGAARKEAA